MASTEPLTVAQILADLMDLQNAVCPLPNPYSASLSLQHTNKEFQDPKAAKELLGANKALSSSESSRKKSIVDNSMQQPSFDFSSRRTVNETASVPNLTRMTSTMSATSMPGTPSEEVSSALDGVDHPKVDIIL